MKIGDKFLIFYPKFTIIFTPDPAITNFYL